MKILLTGINAKFIHSNLAIRYLKAYAHEYQSSIQIKEYTINHHKDYILSELYKEKPDVLCFSCYIWNIEIIKKVMVEFKKVSPKTKIILGGPEVSFDGEDLMERFSSVDMIMIGEGEATFKEVLSHLIDNQLSLENIKGIVYRQDGQVVRNPVRKNIDLNSIPFPYEDFDAFKHRIIYYETSRGCPYNCQYCLSSAEKGVRLRNLDLVYHELQLFLDAKIMQVKFVDRTFNCNKQHAFSIWEYLIDHDNGFTNFHFEISAELLTDDAIDLLAQARPGLFQFEIGVQSTNQNTLDHIKRKTNLRNLFNIVKKIKQGQNIHQHLDLIAGLPEENYGSFKQSFNDVYDIRPDQLQLGFLKVLKGSGVRYDKDKYGLVHQDSAPYEILKTDHLSYEEILKLKMVEEMVEIYYNSHNFKYTMEYLAVFFETPFQLYEALAEYWEEKGYHEMNHNRIKLFSILLEFSKQYGIRELYVIELLKLDMFLKEKPKKVPDWMETSQNTIEIRNFYREPKNIERYLPELIDYSTKQISRMAHIEVFKIDILDWMEDRKKEMIIQETPVLFNYHNRDPLNHQAKMYKIILPVEDD